VRHEAFRTATAEPLPVHHCRYTTAGTITMEKEVET
jgi:hypothetical protein